jgi:hypothetical protein
MSRWMIGGERPCSDVPDLPDDTDDFHFCESVGNQAFFRASPANVVLHQVERTSHTYAVDEVVVQGRDIWVGDLRQHSGFAVNQLRFLTRAGPSWAKPSLMVRGPSCPVARKVLPWAPRRRKRSSRYLLMRSGSVPHSAHGLAGVSVSQVAQIMD